jgi:vesicular inhibitory amino acid transporter
MALLTLQQVSKDLLRTSGYNPYLNQAALWMLVISPLSKFALCTRPVRLIFLSILHTIVSHTHFSQLNITLEIMLGLEATPPPSFPDDDVKVFVSTTGYKLTSHLNFKRFLIVIERIVFTLLSVGVSILIPEFSSVMAFLGSFSAFMLCVIGPVSAKIALAGRCGVWDALWLTIAIVMAIWGTFAALSSS